MSKAIAIAIAIFNQFNSIQFNSIQTIKILSSLKQ
jgi:hypothetical protein